MWQIRLSEEEAGVCSISAPAENGMKDGKRRLAKSFEESLA